MFIVVVFVNMVCVLILLGGVMVGGMMVVIDCCIFGIQVEDEGIELKVGQCIKEQFGDCVYVNVNSYNCVVLLIGEVCVEEDKVVIVCIVSGVENVICVFDEIVVIFQSLLFSCFNDVLIQIKIKVMLVDVKDLISNVFYVVVECGDVFLMGCVIECEVKCVSDLIVGIQGVKCVVCCFEIISEDELVNQLFCFVVKQF